MTTHGDFMVIVKPWLCVTKDYIHNYVLKKDISFELHRLSLFLETNM